MRPLGPILGVLLLVSTLTHPATAQPAGITFHPIDRAVELAVERDKVTVIFFTADGCGWCPKMRSTTFPDPAVRRLAERGLMHLPIRALPRQRIQPALGGPRVTPAVAGGR